MNHSQSFKMIALALLGLGLAIFGWAMQSPVTTQAAGNGEFEIAVWSNGAWRSAGALSFGKDIIQQQMDLSPFALTNPAQIRVTHKGTTAAHLDLVALSGQTPSGVQGASEPSALVAKKLARLDFDVIDAAGKTLTFAFPLNSQPQILTLAARIEAEEIPGVPFEFPVGNVYGAIDSNSRFYSYRLNSVLGALTVNGDLNDENLGEPFFKEWSQPVTGHPANFTYGWVRNDANNLYVAIDFASDNTYDGEKDYTAVYAKTASGVMKFRVSVPEQQWGVPGFEYTDKAAYQHKVYEYRIPLAQAGFNAARNDTIELAFEAYGTSGTGTGPFIPTTTTLSGPSGNFPAPKNFTFQANVVSMQEPGANKPSGKPAVRAPTQTGTVTFSDNGVPIPGCSAVPLVGGVATCTVFLGVGTHVISAVYNGDGIFLPSTSTTTLTIIIAQPVTIPIKVPSEVPEADTLLLLGGGLSGMGVWLRWQWSRRRAKK